MFSSLKKLFGAEPAKPTVTIKSGEIFPWHRGVRLQAIQDSELIFPGEIFREGEQLGSIIETDDEADIGFQQRPDGTFERIILRLKAGQAVTLHRGSDTLLGGTDVAERVFYVLSRA
jgi:hypothetical protein